jgi:hypothetical protein
VTDSTARVLYLAGADRSGSTVLAMLLGDMPGCVGVGELREVWQRGVRENRLCGCGTPFADCPFWAEVGERAFGGWRPEDAERQVRLRRAVDRQRHLPTLLSGRGRGAFRAELREYGDRQRRVYDAVATVSGGRLIVDSSKRATYALALHAAGVSTRVVHLVRDPRAVAHSWTRTRVMPDAHHAKVQMPTFRPGRASAMWMSDNLAIEAMRRVSRGQVTMRYESLVSAPREELARAIDGETGEVAEADLERFGAASIAVGVQHSVAGNPVRMREGGVTLRADEEWRSAMTPADRRTVVAVTWPLLLRYGYPLGAGKAHTAA